MSRGNRAILLTRAASLLLKGSVAVQAGRRKVLMIHDFLTPGELALPPDATVVVGSGPAGLATALALADAGERVVLLESGGDSRVTLPSAESADLNLAFQTGLPLDGVVNGRARMVGGTTSLWHGQCMRMHDIDLSERDWVPHSGWPIPARELARHYDTAEAFLDVSGKGYGASRWLDYKRLAPLDWDDQHLLHDFTEYTPHPHLGHVYRNRLVAHVRLHLVLNATVSRVVVGEGQVVGVQIVARDRPTMFVPARRVVLASGGFENARTLMLSDQAGIGLGTGREHTGRYYQDHPIIRTAQVVARDYRVLQDRYIALHRRGRRLFPKLRLSPDAQRRHRLLDATAVFVHEHDDPAREALRRLIASARYRRRPQQPLSDVLLSMGAPLSVTRDIYRRYVKGTATGARPSAVWLQLWLEQQPDPDSRMTLNNDRDHLGLRRSTLHWRCSDLELQTSRTMTRWISDDLQRLGLGEVKELPVMVDDRAWRSAVGDAAHPAGTTRMSADSSNGVVDVNLQVHGVRHLYVTGSSVFPICGYANPTLTVVALSMRLAKHLTTSSQA